MRAARMEPAFGHARTPLVVKGSLPKTFWALGMFVLINLSLFGIYLLTQAIREPLAADQVTVIGAGVSLALAAFLLLFLVRFKWKAALAEREDDEEDDDETFEMSLTAYEEVLRARAKEELALRKERSLPGPM